MAYVAPPGPASQAVKDAVGIFTSGGASGVGGVKAGAARYGDEVVGFGSKVGRGVKNLLFRGGGKAAPKIESGIAKSATQAGDDVVRAVNDVQPTVPVAGAPGPSRAFPTNFVVKAGIGIPAAAAGGFVVYNYGPKLINKLSDAAADAVGPQGPVGAAGETINTFLGGFTGALGNGLADIFGGTGEGIGQGLYNTLAGVGGGLKKVALPAALIGLGFLAFTFLNNQPRRRRA